MKPKFGHKSKESALNGVSLFIQTNYSELVPKYKESGQFYSFLSKFIREFLKENSLPIKNDGTQSSLNYNANIVQDNWSLFKKYLSDK